MSTLRSRVAVSPLRRALDADAAALHGVDQLVRAERPTEPMHCLRPATITAAAASFVADFPGEAMYAVKCNPEPAVLRALWAGGVRRFDCASAAEIALVRQMFPDASIHFMHPVKPRPAIREAYAAQGVRDFALDSADELAKILDETGEGMDAAGGDLGLFVRLALPCIGARYDLSGKFGLPVDDAASLLRTARGKAQRLGLTFHVGSQCMDPLAYRRALALAGEAIRLAGVPIDVIDVGGGFPVEYPDLQPPPLGAYFAEIEAGFEALDLPAATRLWAEPGRALVAAGGSVVVQVLLRRDGALFVNDGVYGSLADAGPTGFVYPARLIRADAARRPHRRPDARLRTVRPDLRQRRPHARPVRAARRRARGRLDRARPARRLRRLPAHRVQRLRPRPPGRGVRRAPNRAGDRRGSRRSRLIARPALPGRAGA